MQEEEMELWVLLSRVGGIESIENEVAFIKWVWKLNFYTLHYSSHTNVQTTQLWDVRLDADKSSRTVWLVVFLWNQTLCMSGQKSSVGVQKQLAHQNYKLPRHWTNSGSRHMQDGILNVLTHTMKLCIWWFFLIEHLEFAQSHLTYPDVVDKIVHVIFTYS